MPTPDIWITPVRPAGPTVGFGLAGSGKASQYASGGYAWTPVVRPRRKPYLEFTSDQLVQLEMPLLLDGADREQSIEHQVAVVEAWRHPTSATREPAVLTVSGPVAQLGVTSWVVQQVEWGTDAQIRRPDGALIQQDLTLVLLEYTGSSTLSPTPTLSAQVAALIGVLTQTGVQIPPQLTSLLQQLPALLSSANPAITSSVTAEIAQFLTQLPANQAGAATVVANALPQLAQVLPNLVGARTYVVRDGDTLARIAARELGDHRKWTTIAALNGIRDPASIQTNQRLLLP